jgi:hypothetical protein
MVGALGIAGLHKFLKYGTWLRGALAPYLIRKVAAAQVMTGGFWDAGALGQMAREHIAGGRDFPAEINAVLTLESVQRQLFRDLPLRLEI